MPCQMVTTSNKLSLRHTPPLESRDIATVTKAINVQHRQDRPGSRLQLVPGLFLATISTAHLDHLWTSSYQHTFDLLCLRCI